MPAVPDLLLFLAIMRGSGLATLKPLRGGANAGGIDALL